MLHLHIGAKPVALNRIVLTVVGLNLRTEINGDGWKTWGSPVGDKDNDNNTLHVIIPVVDYDEAMKAVNALKPQLIEPSQQGKTYHVTTSDNWAEDLPAEEYIRQDLKDALKRLREDAVSLYKEYGGAETAKKGVEKDYNLLLSYLASTV